MILCRVSIHVPTRGTTFICNLIADRAKVSIHVPTRGTTWSRNDDQLRISGFNPRSHEGNDKSVMTWLRVSFLFQSTFPRGERQVCDDLGASQYSVSIHVPTRGTTLPTEEELAEAEFQSTFPRGERRMRS